MLNSLRSLSLSGDPWPNYVRLEWEADDEEIRSPPTTHLIATVDDLTDVLDFDSKDIDGMDDDAGEEQEPPPIGCWAATSSYDIYMVDTPKKAMAMRQRTITPWRSNLSIGIIGAALSPAIAKIVIPAQITIRMVPKMKTILPSQASSRTSKRKGKLALNNRQLMENQRTIITCLSPKTK